METDIVIIGAGVVGLAIAYELSKNLKKEIILLEKNESFGMETSSRNSEVIHGGMYYPKGSLKAKLCVDGRRLIYDFCEKYNVPFKKIGKYIIATSENEIDRMREILKQGTDNGVENFYEVSPDYLKRNNPDITAVACLFSQESGIIDTHSLMKTLQNISIDQSATIVYCHQVVGIKKIKEKYEIKIKNNNVIFTLKSDFVINSAGLYSDKIAEMVGIDIVKENLELSFCKGRYYRINNRKKYQIQNLIYPIPPVNFTGLGIHVTIDMADGLKLGPDTIYISKNELNYSVEDVKQKFYDAASRYINNLNIDDLSPDQSGIRPKLQKQGEPFRDFYIKEESEKGYPKFINLIGIESPGLTSSLAIAKFVRNYI